jgi:hypothetical protein
MGGREPPLPNFMPPSLGSLHASSQTKDQSGSHPSPQLRPDGRGHPSVCTPVVLGKESLWLCWQPSFSLCQILCLPIPLQMVVLRALLDKLSTHECPFKCAVWGSQLQHTLIIILFCNSRIFEFSLYLFSSCPDLHCLSCTLTLPLLLAIHWNTAKLQFLPAQGSLEPLCRASTILFTLLCIFTTVPPTPSYKNVSELLDYCRQLKL